MRELFAAEGAVEVRVNAADRDIFLFTVDAEDVIHILRHKQEN